MTETGNLPTKSTEPANHDHAVNEQLKLMVHRRNRRNWIYLASFVLCLLVGLVWMCFIDMRRPGNTFLVLAVAAPLMGLMVDFLWKLPRAKCPACGCDWELADSEWGKDWDQKICPGCGLKVRDGEQEDFVARQPDGKGLGPEEVPRMRNPVEDVE